MKKFMFTFGQNHFTLNGYPMKDHWVTVIAENYDQARIIFCGRFAEPEMGALSKWAFQYEEKDFNPEYFPGGEYLVISQEPNTVPNEL